MTVPLQGGTDARLLGERYELGSRLGEGGMGVVYRARDTLLGRTVAVKMFRNGATESDRTGSETRLLASLNHPSLVTLFDAHVAGEDPHYLVMEFVDGPSLDARLRGGPLARDSAARLARDLSGALHVVHEAGIVHRDIKPANVLLRPSSVPDEEFHAKLADFGIAHLIDSARLTTPGTVIGSAAYLSPEQVTGSPPHAASDIYALGLVLLESLTGQRVFAQIAPHESAIARLSQDPVIPASVGRAWGTLLASMTARDPERRPTALDVMMRVGAIDGRASATPASETRADITEPDLLRSRPATAGDPPTIVPSAQARPAVPRQDARTLVAPVDPVPADPAEDRPARHRRTPRAWMAAAAIAVLLVIGVAVGTAVSGSVPDDAAPPTLPAVEEPLGAHLRQLLDAVSR